MFYKLYKNHIKDKKYVFTLCIKVIFEQHKRFRSVTKTIIRKAWHDL